MPYRYPKLSQYKCTRKPYRARNWSAYETALRKRGELTLWFPEGAIEVWHAPVSGKPGGQRIYSDLAIENAVKWGTRHSPMAQSVWLYSAEPRRDRENASLTSLLRAG